MVLDFVVYFKLKDDLKKKFGIKTEIDVFRIR